MEKKRKGVVGVDGGDIGALITLVLAAITVIRFFWDLVKSGIAKTKETDLAVAGAKEQAMAADKSLTFRVLQLEMQVAHNKEKGGVLLEKQSELNATVSSLNENFNLYLREYTKGHADVEGVLGKIDTKFEGINHELKDVKKRLHTVEEELRKMYLGRNDPAGTTKGS